MLLWGFMGLLVSGPFWRLLSETRMIKATGLTDDPPIGKLWATQHSCPIQTSAQGPHTWLMYEKFVVVRIRSANPLTRLM